MTSSVLRFPSRCCYGLTILPLYKPPPHGTFDPRDLDLAPVSGCAQVHRGIGGGSSNFTVQLLEMPGRNLKADAFSAAAWPSPLLVDFQRTRMWSDAQIIVIPHAGEQVATGTIGGGWWEQTGAGCSLRCASLTECVNDCVRCTCASVSVSRGRQNLQCSPSCCKTVRVTMTAARKTSFHIKEAGNTCDQLARAHAQTNNI